MAKQKRQYKQDQPSSIDLVGKIQPQARELEEAVLGAILIEKKAFFEVEDLLKTCDFYDPVHQLIFSAMCRLNSQRKPIDILTVVEELKAMGELDSVGGPLYITQLTDKVASSVHIVYHSNIIKQKALARDLIAITSQIQSKAYDDSIDIQETMEELEKSFTDLVSGSSKSQSISMSEALTKATDIAAKAQELKEQGVEISVSTGLNSLNDELDGGWYSPNLIIIGARPSMGKTQHALNFAKAAGMANKHVLFIAIEMNSTELVNRYLLEDNRIKSSHLRKGQMTDQEWQAVDEKVGEYWNMKLHIADSPDIRYLNNMRSEARRLKRKGQLDMMIIDYLGLIRTNLSFSQRYLEIGYITGELKNLAKELEVPIILLSQLSRPQKGVIKEPQLDDLRESGDIEQDADTVLFIHKPDYYDANAEDSKGEKWKGRGKLIIAKNRAGARNNSVIFYHDDRYKKIWDKSEHISTPSNYHPVQNIQGGDTPF